MIQVNNENSVVTIVMENTNVDTIVSLQKSLIGVLQQCCGSEELESTLGTYMFDCLSLLGNLLPEYNQQKIAFSINELDDYFKIPECLTEKQRSAIKYSLLSLASPEGKVNMINPIVRAIDSYKQ